MVGYLIVKNKDSTPNTTNNQKKRGQDVSRVSGLEM